ncbi:Zn(2)-C6 fungal-type domain-containing protein [Fusarium sp. Ph1]|nr:Zn(2)-C6 fungal-type domain-containing protein [Fusarium sp. Ph1]
MSPETDKAKRTRTNVRQSKFGCFTCKARRVKCDEAKPSCRRCLTAKRHCQGYPRGAPSESSSPSTATSSPLSSSPPSTLSSASSSSPIFLIPDLHSPSSPLAKLACTVLVQSPRRAKNTLELEFWSRIVPQLTHSVPSVQAAVEAFGACYKEYVLKSDSTNTGLETTKRYIKALKLAQLDLSTMQHGPLPCMIACLLLASIEAIQQRLYSGHVHLNGALALMASHSSEEATPMIDMEYVSLFRKLDLHIATYAVGIAPHLPPQPPITADELLSGPPDKSLSRVLHSCYHFISAGYAYKYTSRRIIPPELLIEQGRQLSNMRQWLEYNQVPSPDTCDQDESLLVLRTQCLAALVYASCVLDPRETAYDCFGPEFEEIVTSVEALPPNINQDQTLRYGDLSTLLSYTPEMGIIHPLYFVARKYRHRRWRRRALHLLIKSGREGPWCGEIEGAAASSVIWAEEGIAYNASLDLAGPEDTVMDDPINILERNRVHVSGPVAVDDKEDEYGNVESNQMSHKRLTKVHIFRCCDIEAMLRDDGHQPRFHPWKGSNHWEEWMDPLEPVS